MDHVRNLLSDLSVGLELMKDNGTSHLQSLVGNSKQEGSIRGLFAKDMIRTAAQASSEAECDFFFNQGGHLG